MSFIFHYNLFYCNIYEGVYINIIYILIQINTLFITSISFEYNYSPLISINILEDTYYSFKITLQHYSIITYPYFKSPSVYLFITIPVTFFTIVRRLLMKA